MRRRVLTPLLALIGLLVLPLPTLAESDWRACRLQLTLFRSGTGGMAALETREETIFLGEDTEISGELELVARGQRLVLDLRTRVRAFASDTESATYVIASRSRQLVPERPLNHPGREQFRDTMLKLDQTGTLFVELHRDPETGLNLLLALEATPLSETVEDTTPTLESFDVAVVRRAGRSVTVLQSSRVTAATGGSAGVTFELKERPDSRVVAGGDREKDPSRRFGEGVRVVERERLERSGFGDRHLESGKRRDDLTAWNREHRGLVETSFLEEHRIEHEPSDLIVARSRRAKKISNKKRAKLREQVAIARARERAVAKSRGEDPDADPDAAPKPDQKLRIEVAPLHASEGSVRVRVSVRGQVELPQADRPAPLDATLSEILRRGEPFELSLGGLIDDEPPEDDYVLRITPRG